MYLYNTNQSRTKMSKSIIIVDDHTLFAKSLVGLINSFDDFEVVEVMKNGQEMVNHFKDKKPEPDIVLLDIRMPVMDGIETMGWLKDHRPDQKVLALTMEHDEETIIKMIRLGCRGYLLKDIDPDEFLHALTSVYQEGYYNNEETREAMAHQMRHKNIEELSPREKEFLNLACSERTYKEVAEVMNLSPKTIDGYRENLFQKLEVKSRVGLVLFAVKNRMVSL